jgi:hypothetical protein
MEAFGVIAVGGLTGRRALYGRSLAALGLQPPGRCRDTALLVVQGSSQGAAGPRSCFCEEQKPKGVSADRGARPRLRKPEQRSARIADSDREWEHGGPTTDRRASREA